VHRECLFWHLLDTVGIFWIGGFADNPPCYKCKYHLMVLFLQAHEFLDHEAEVSEDDVSGDDEDGSDLDSLDGSFIDDDTLLTQAPPTQGF